MPSILTPRGKENDFAVDFMKKTLEANSKVPSVFAMIHRVAALSVITAVNQGQSHQILEFAESLHSGRLRSKKMIDAEAYRAWVLAMYKKNKLPITSYMHRFNVYDHIRDDNLMEGTQALGTLLPKSFPNQSFGAVASSLKNAVSYLGKIQLGETRIDPNDLVEFQRALEKGVEAVYEDADIISDVSNFLDPNKRATFSDSEKTIFKLRIQFAIEDIIDSKCRNLSVESVQASAKDTAPVVQRIKTQPVG